MFSLSPFAQFIPMVHTLSVRLALESKLARECDGTLSLDESLCAMCGRCAKCWWCVDRDRAKNATVS
jgi:hypothetical protein